MRMDHDELVDLALEHGAAGRPAEFPENALYMDAFEGARKLAAQPAKPQPAWLQRILARQGVPA